MLQSPNIQRALTICKQAHANQTDKSGKPYYLHPVHVAEQMQDEATTIAALLHDVVEDTSVTLQDLQNEGFAPEIIEAIGLLTHKKEVPYFTYVENLKNNPIARAVKIADLTHNSDLSRLPLKTEKDIARFEKYQKALQILHNATNERNLH